MLHCHSIEKLQRYTNQEERELPRTEVMRDLYHHKEENYKNI